MSFIVDARIRNANDVAIAADGSFAIVANYDGNNVARIELMQKKRPKNARKFAAAGKGKKKRSGGGGGGGETATATQATINKEETRTAPPWGRSRGSWRAARRRRFWYSLVGSATARPSH